jgi:hypothetical protein
MQIMRDGVEGEWEVMIKSPEANSARVVLKEIRSGGVDD